MQPGALAYLATCFEPRAPGLAVVLRDWDIVLPHDPLLVAQEALAHLDGAHRLARLVPADGIHREVIELLTVVFHAACREVFSRDAARRSHV